MNKTTKLVQLTGTTIHFNNVGKKYEGNIDYTLENINFQIDKGDFCVMLGPSGCGKTTLLRMIAGLNSITKGDLLFDGKRVNDLQPKDRDISMVFQSYALYPHMNVYRNMSFSLQIARFPKDVIHRRVVEAAKLLNIYEHLYSKPAALSGGQRQRVALGRAIVRRPKIFLMDEPLSNLDAKLRETMRTELVKIHKTLGSTTIYVTHDQLEAMTMGTKIVLLNYARIQQIGKPRDLYEKPINTFVAQFIGTPTMNLYKGYYLNGYFIALNSQKNEIFRIEVTAKDKELIQKHHVSELLLGIRSEHVHVSNEKTPIKAFVNSIEVLGKEKEIKAQFDETNAMVASVRIDVPVKDDTDNYFIFDNHHFHFFNKKGNRLT